MAASIFSNPARLVVLNRHFTSTPAVLIKKSQSTKRIPSKKAMAAKIRRRAAKEAKLVDHSDDMTLEAAIAVLRVSPRQIHPHKQLTTRFTVGGGGGTSSRSL
jgi:hypothetical protein